jgi:hypothetical protein
MWYNFITFASMDLDRFNKYDSIQIDVPEEKIEGCSYPAIFVRGFFDYHTFDKIETRVSLFLRLNRGIEYFPNFVWKEGYIMRPCRIVLVEKLIKDINHVL